MCTERRPPAACVQAPGEQRAGLLGEGQHAPARASGLLSPPAPAPPPSRAHAAPRRDWGLAFPSRKAAPLALHLAGSHPACSPPGSAPPRQPGPGAASTWSSPEVPVPPDAPPYALVHLESNVGKGPEHCASGSFLLPPASGQTWGDRTWLQHGRRPKPPCTQATACPRNVLPPPRLCGIR